MRSLALTFAAAIACLLLSIAWRATPPAEIEGGAGQLEKLPLSFIENRGQTDPKVAYSGDRGELQGTFTTASGGVVQVTMVLVKEAGAWKVPAFQTAR